MDFRVGRFFLTALAALLLAAVPAQADPLTADTLFLLVPKTNDTFPGASSGSIDLVTIINFGPFGGAFPFLEVDTSAGFGDLPAGLNTVGREFLFLGGFTVPNGGFGDAHVYKGYAPGEAPVGIPIDIQGSIVSGLAEMNALSTDLASPGGNADVGFSALLGQLNNTGSPDAFIGGFVFDDVYSTFSLGGAPDIVEGSEFVFAQGNGDNLSICIDCVQPPPPPDPTGAGTGSVTIDGQTLTGGYAPVPEPSAFVLVLGGLVAIGLLHRRRRSG